MKKLIFITVFSLFFTSTLQVIATVPPEPASQYYGHVSLQVSAKAAFKKPFKRIHTAGSNINILLKADSIYLTSQMPDTLNFKAMKPLKLSPGLSTKLLVNKDNPLAKDFTQKNLTVISADKIKLEYTGLKLAPAALEALYSMAAAAKKEGVDGFIINSAYRSRSTQQQIFEANLNSFKRECKTYAEAYARTRELVALPGCSEHHTGLAVDIFSMNGRHRSNFEDTKEQIWLSINLEKYGFIIRYPKAKTKETNAVYEPWHIRYVGIPLSTYMKEKKLCLEEFYAKVLSGEILESSKSMFMGLRSTQQVFIDQALIPRVSLEKVNEGNALLSLNK